MATRRGPPIELRDPAVFYETSSYGPTAIEMIASRVGETQLVYGSDRPVVEPVATGWDAQLKTNGRRLFASMAVDR